MKKLIIALFAGVMFLTSCDSFLDRVPPLHLETEIAILNVRDAETAINGLYDILQRNTYYNHHYLAYGDIRADDIQSDKSNQVSWHLYIFNHDMPNAQGITSLSGRFWFNPMHLSRNASRIIEVIDNGTVSDGTQAQRDAIKGHAIALRAMAHFDQVKVFGYPWAKDQGKSWGAILIDHVLKEDEMLARSTVDETFDFITKELKRAIPLMSTQKNNMNKMNAYGARALLARAYLYWEKNEEAFEVASELIEDLRNTPYRLFTREEYPGAFAYNSYETNFDPESLLELFNVPTDNPGRDGYAYMCHPKGYVAMMVTAAFRSVIQSDPNDIRNKMVGYYANGAPYLNKYPGRDSEAAFDNNYPLIRVSEVYLIAAEAAVKGTDPDDRAKGLEYLNDIVKRANPDNEVTDADYKLDRVLHERRLEFLGEGHRYFDLLRNGKTFQRTGGYHYPQANMVINWDYYKCVLPIPQDQFFLNKKLQQNPVYLVE